MSVYLLRHGQTDWNKTGLIQGRYDTPLNETGFSQAREAREKLKDIDIKRVYVSPLLRARQTAETAMEGREVPFIEDARLAEMAYGIYEGTDYRGQEYQTLRRYLAYRYPNGESYFDVAHRAFSFLDEIRPIAEKEDVLLVCHGAIARAINAYFEDQIDNDLFIDLICPNGGIRKYEYKNREIPVTMPLPKK